MAYPDRNQQNNNNTTAPPSTNVFTYKNLLQALLENNPGNPSAHQPRAPQTAAGYGPTIDHAPVHPTPTNRRKSVPGRKQSITDFMKNSLETKLRTTLTSETLPTSFIGWGYS